MKLTRRFLSMLLCLAMVLSWLPANVFAVSELEFFKQIDIPEQPAETAQDFVFVEPGQEDDEPVGDVIITKQGYRIQKNPDLQSYTILEYLGSDKDVVIPSEYEGLPITRLGAYAFSNNAALRSVKIPQTINRIEEGVFDGCTKLTYQKHGNGKYLGSESNPYFYYWGPTDAAKISMTEATMHENTQIVAAFAFRGCENLRSVVVPNSVKQVGYGMVFGCDLESITLPFVGELGTDKNPQFGWAFGARSFGGNISYVPLCLKSVTITGGEDGRQGKIAQGAFYGVDMIQEITLPFLGGSVDNTSNAFISYYWGANSYNENILPPSVKNVTILGGKLGGSAFYKCTNLERLIILEGATYIYGNTFYDCSNLTYVAIPDTLTTIGEFAFSGCSNLSSLIIPESVTSIGSYAFYNCRKLIELNIPEGVTSIGSYAFYNCSSLISITLPDGVTSIGNSAFYGCSSLASIILPDGATSIGNSAFYKCSSLKSITLPDCVTSIGNSAFYGCSSLASIVIPTGVTSIEYDTFYACNNLTSIAIPTTVTTIDRGAFMHCSSLTTINIPLGVTTIGKDAFRNCSSLSSVTFPLSVTTVGSYAFLGCTGMDTVYIGDLSAWCNIQFANSSANPLDNVGSLIIDGESVTNLVIPSGVTAIGSYTFANCSGLTSVTIPSSVTSIGEGAFTNCDSLYQVKNNSALIMDIGGTNNGYVSHYALKIVDSNGTAQYKSGYAETTDGFLYRTGTTNTLVAYLGDADPVTLPTKIDGKDYTIYQMRGVRNAIIPEGMTSISKFAFYECTSLKSITIPATVTTIGDSAFFGCNNLENVHISDLSSWCEIGFNNNEANPLVRAKGLFVNKKKVRDITVPENITSLKAYAFYAPYALDSVTISKNVQSLGQSCFSKNVGVNVDSGNSYLQVIDGIIYNKSATKILLVTKDAKNIRIPSSVTAIANSAFSGCTNIESVVIPNSVTSIGKSAFRGCTNLSSITLPNSVSSIGDNTFYDCSSLENIVIPNSVTSIGQSAFLGCTNLSSITLPNSVSSIGSYAFRNCSKLKTIVIPSKITSISKYCFNGCSSLNSITIPDNILNIDDYAFGGCSSLKSITIPDSVITMGKYVFSNCSSLTDVTIPNSVTSIGDGCFSGCSSITSFSIPYGVISISSSTFSGCSGLVSVTIPNSVTSIGNSAFNDCSSLVSITFPNGLTSIGSNAFTWCSGLTSITIPASVTSIGASAFSWCINLNSTYISDLTAWCNIQFGNYDANPLYFAKNLYINGEMVTNLEIPTGVTTISGYAFYGYAALTSVTIPTGVTTIGNEAFRNCSSLYKVINNSSLSLSVNSAENGYVAYYAKILVNKDGSISYYGGNASVEYTETPEGFLYEIENGKYSLIAYTGPLNTVTLPLSINGNQYSIDEMRGVQNVIIPDGMQFINYGAFDSCCSLLYITIPASVTSISSNAFYGCKSLTSVTIPNSVTSISSRAFYGCSNLKEVYINSQVNISSNAFENCNALHTVEMTGIRYLSNSVFVGCENLSLIRYNGEENEWRHVLKASDWDAGMPEYSMEYTEDTGILYETDQDRTEFYISGVDIEQKMIAPPATYSGRPVAAVLSKAFSGNETIESVALPETIAYIGEKAFVNCTALQNIQFPEGLQQMQQGVLYGCESLENLALPFLGCDAADIKNAFLGYTFGGYTYKDNLSYVPESLSVVTLKKGTEIRNHAFENCSNLQKINLPDSVTKIGDYAFAVCSSLQSIQLPPDTATIGAYAFSGCSAMEQIALSKTLASIGNYCFRGCDSLKKLELPNSVVSVGVMILDGCDSLTEIAIGAGLTYGGIADTHDQANGNPFFGLDKSASRLKSYTVAAGNPDFVVHDNILYRKMIIDGQSVEVEVVDAPAKANLRNYDMPEGIVKIGAYAFAYNNTLRSIDLDYVRMVGNNAFYCAENLIYADFGKPSDPSELFEGVDAICYNQYVGQEAFMGCTSLQSVNLESEMLLGVDEAAFADCSALTSVTLGKNIQYVGIGAFGSSGSGAPALETILVDAQNPYYESIDGVLYQENEDNTLTLLLYPAMSDTYTVENGNNVFRVPAERVTGVESYAFRMAQNLDEIYLQPAQEMRVGDYAFANTMLKRVHVGKNVVSLGLKRGEGEYTVFADCNHLVAVEVDPDNKYYSSQDGVLFNKGASKLIKYPTAKAGSLYEVPDTVEAIASMSFKNNNDLQHVRIQSQVNTVGLEAFYGCSNLSWIFFENVYAPVSVLENAFTTYDSLNEAHDKNPRTKLGYSQGYYLDGPEGEYGWHNYENVYNIVLCQSLPETETRAGNEFYAIVVVDSEGNRLGNIHVTLTDPSGVKETIATGMEGANAGVGVFYDLFDTAGMGFSLVYDGTYSLKVSDRSGEYFTYVNPSFYLDEEMRITYVTLTKLPSVYGTTCGDTDINTESAEINKAEYGYTNVELINDSLGYVEGNLKTSEQSEYLDISVIAYCDTTSGWAFLDAQGASLDPATNGLYQNGIKLCDVASVEVQEDAVIFTFRVDVAKLLPEVQLEARVKAFSNSGETYVCASILNIHVFDFVVTEDDVNLDTEELEIDLAGQNELLAKLFGSSSIDVNLGKNLSFGVSVDGSRVEMTLGGTYDKSFEKGSVGAYASYEDGYEANHQAHNKNTYFFQFKDVYTDKDGVKHNLTYNVRFARGTEKSNYFYYRCYVYEGDYKNEVAKFFGAVNGLNDSLAKVVGARTYRERVASKALMIYKVHLTMANKEAKTVKDISKLDSSAIYIEAIAKSPSYTNSHSFDVELSGKLIFEYDRENGLKPVSSEIHGELYYTFNHNSQFVVWVIPVVLEVEVKVGGEVDITLKFDADRGISLDEAKLTLSAAISAKVGVGCSVASIGVYGSIGTVFVLDFYPELGVDSWTLNGEIGAYMKVLWYTKQFTIAKFDNYELMNTTAENISMAQTMAELYLVENYSSDDLDPCAGNARIVCVGDQIYRISYIDASDRAGYDTYNYRKLAVAAWDGSDWSEAVIIDDNHKNDASYDLYCTEEEMYVVFTQQSEVLTGESVDDTYASSANMVIKVAKITDLNDAAVTTVHTGSYYKYLPTITQANGVLTVAWVENADNNMFGVSPQNYIDEKGESYIVATTANAVYTSTLADDDWLTPVKVQDGLAPVTDVALGTNGTVCYIVDGNSDLGDSEDRVLYTVADEAQTPIAVNDPQSGSVTNVEADGNSVVYYFSSANETQSSGLRWLNAPEGVIPSLSNVDITSDKYKILRDESGNITAVFFTAVKAWQENEKSVDGSAIYAMFYNDGQWGQPVELGVFPAEPNVYISHFDVMYKTDASVMIVADFVDQNGLLLQQLTEENFLLETDLKVTEYQVDYVNRILAVTVANNGAKTAQLQTSVDGQEKVTYDLKIPSGSSQTISVTLPKESLQPVVKVYDSLKADAVCTISDIQLNYSDISPYAKQLLLGAQNKLLLAVKNTGVQNNAGYLIVRPGNYDAETIQAAELLAAAEQTYGGEIPQAGPIAVNDDEQGLFWIVRVAVEPGAISHYEIPLDEAGYIQNNGLFSIYAYVDDSLEKGNAAENNIVYVSYQQLTGVLEELPRPAISVSLTEKVVLNFYVPEDLVNERNQIVVKYNGEVMDASRYVVAPETATKEYRISIPLNANNMCDELSLQVWSANGVPVTQERTTSIRDYVRLRLDSAKASDKEKRVFIAALDYGALAQLAMDANTADLANSIVTEKDRELLTDFAWPTATNTADAAIGSTDESKFAVTASLKDAVVLNFYIYKTDLGADKIQIKRNGAVLTAGEDYTITEVGKEYCVSIPMNANHMCDIFSAQVVDAEGNAVHAARSLSMRHYVGMRLANPKATEAEKRVFIAALDYGALAQLAMNESATDLANRYITAADRENLNP